MSTSPTSVVTHFELPELARDSEYYYDYVFKQQAIIHPRFNLDFQRQKEESVNREVAKRVKKLEEIIKAEKEETIKMAMILVSVANGK